MSEEDSKTFVPPRINTPIGKSKKRIEWFDSDSDLDPFENDSKKQKKILKRIVASNEEQIKFLKEQIQIKDLQIEFFQKQNAKFQKHLQQKDTFFQQLIQREYENN